MHFTIKQLSEALFEWLSKILLEDYEYRPKEINLWNAHDWKVAQTIVFMHGMGPIWGERCISGWQSPEMPANFREYLVQQYQENKIRIEKIQVCYQKIKSLFAQNEIAFVPFKGIEIGSRIYPDPAVRPMADIDLYVGSQNKNEVNSILVLLGFLPAVVTGYGITFYPEEWLKNKKGTFPFKSKDLDFNEDLYYGENQNSPFGIDVHFEMKIRALPGLTRTFEDARQSSGKLSAAEHFIYLLVHAGKHLLAGSGRWLHLYDIYLFNKNHEIDYNLIVRKSIELKVTHLLLIPLVLCRPIFSELQQLESLLIGKIGWRHQLLMKNLQLSEMSCCNPWMVNPFSLFFWAHGFADFYRLLVEFKNRKKNTLVRRDSSFVSIPWAGNRLIRIANRTFRKLIRDEWSIMASHKLDPKHDWK